MASGLITSLQISDEKISVEEKKETVTNFISLGSKIIVDGDCRHEIKRRKAMTRIDNILKSRYKVPSSKNYGFTSSYVHI